MNDITIDRTIDGPATEIRPTKRERPNHREVSLGREVKGRGGKRRSTSSFGITIFEFPESEFRDTTQLSGAGAVGEG
jgi:hypothetical protein